MALYEVTYEEAGEMKSEVIEAPGPVLGRVTTACHNGEEYVYIPEPRVSHGFKDGDWITSTSLPRRIGR